VANTEEFIKEATGDLDIVTPYRQLVAETTGENSLYIRAKETLLSYFNEPDNTLSVREKTEMLSKLITDITVQTTDRLMTIALQTAVENRDAGYKLAKEREDILLIQAQKDKITEEIKAQQYQYTNILPKEVIKLQAETEYVSTQRIELTENGIKDRLLKDKQYDKLNREISLLQTQEQETISASVRNDALKEAQIQQTLANKELIDKQKSEAGLNGIATRAVKDKDVIVKEKQASLYDRQKAALDDSLLKDLYKEASGGAAMVYADADGAIVTPTHWSKLDKLANIIAQRVDNSVDLTTD